jgi:hypothetical protein
MAGRKRASSATPKTHKKHKVSRRDTIAAKQETDRQTNGKTKQTKSAPIEVPASVRAETSPQSVDAPTPGVNCVAHGAVLHQHVNKVRATCLFVLDNTILFPSIRRLFVDSFKNQQKVKAISPDNLKKLAIHHFPAAMTYSSNVVTAPGKSKRLAEKSAALRRTNVITQDDDIDNIREEDDDEPPRYNLPRTVLTYGTVESSVMRQYVLEDVLQSEVDNDLLILVSPKHINYISF